MTVLRARADPSKRFSTVQLTNVTVQLTNGILFRKYVSMRGDWFKIVILKNSKIMSLRFLCVVVDESTTTSF